MKTILLSIASIFAACCHSPAIEYNFKYTFAEGNFWKGSFSGGLPGATGFIQDAVGGNAIYSDHIRNIGGLADFYWPLEFTTNTNQIPLFGAMGIRVAFFDDASFAHEEHQFEIFRATARWQFFGHDGITYSASEVFDPLRWELHQVPESPATLSLLSLGIAGVKRGWR